MGQKASEGREAVRPETRRAAVAFLALSGDGGRAPDLRRGRRPRGCTCESAGNQNGDAGEQGQRTKGDG